MRARSTFLEVLESLVVVEGAFGAGHLSRRGFSLPLVLQELHVHCYRLHLTREFVEKCFDRLVEFQRWSVRRIDLRILQLFPRIGRLFQRLIESENTVGSIGTGVPVTDAL